MTEVVTIIPNRKRFFPEGNETVTPQYEMTKASRDLATLGFVFIEGNKLNDGFVNLRRPDGWTYKGWSQSPGGFTFSILDENNRKRVFVYIKKNSDETWDLNGSYYHLHSVK